MRVNAPSLSFTGSANFSVAAHLVSEGCFCFVSFLLARTVMAVVTEVGSDSMHPAVGDLVTFSVGALRFRGWTVPGAVVIAVAAPVVTSRGLKFL